MSSESRDEKASPNKFRIDAHARTHAHPKYILCSMFCYIIDQPTSHDAVPDQYWASKGFLDSMCVLMIKC